jgi:hypothetical protein
MMLEGVVEARNERGIRLDGEWRNVSRFKPLDLPEVGTHVRAEVDGKGFLKSVELLDEEVAARSVARDDRITRLAVLKAAAHFGHQKDIKSADVLRIADSWLEWVQRE